MRRRVSRRLVTGLAAILLMVILVAVGFLTIFHTRPQPVATQDGAAGRLASHGGAGEDQPGLQFAGTKLVGRHKGEKQWELVAEKIGLPEADKLVRVKGIRDGVVYKDGKPFLHLSADEAVYQMDVENFTLKGRIRARTRDGDALQADELHWDNASRKLVSGGPATLSLNGAEVTAGRLVIDSGDEKLILQGGVVISREKERIRAPEAVYLLKDRALQIMGPAEVQLMLERQEKGR